MLEPNPHLTWGDLKALHQWAIQNNTEVSDDLLQDDDLAAQAETMPDDAPFFSDEQINAYWGEGGFPEDIYAVDDEPDWQYDFAVDDSGQIVYLIRYDDTMELRRGGQWVELLEGDPLLDQIDELTLVDTDESSIGEYDTKLENKHVNVEEV